MDWYPISNAFEFEEDSINLNEALEARKALNERIGELHQQVVASSYELLYAHISQIVV